MTDELAFLKRCEDDLAPLKLNARGLRIFLTLAEHETPVQFGAFAKELAIYKPSLTRITDSLTHAGLATRTRSKKDGRTCFLELTDKGREAAQRILKPVTVGDVFGLPGEVYREPRTEAA